MKNIITLCLAIISVAVFAEVKPLAEPWLKEGETLLCFGDSLTASKVGYVKYLTEKLGAKGIKVINGGLSGDKTPMALTRIRQDVAEKKPDAVLFFFGTNDAVIGRGRWSDEPIVSPITYRDNLVWMIHFLRLRTKITKFSIATIAGRPEGKHYLEYGNIRDEYFKMAREAADLTGAVLVPLDSETDYIRDAMQPNEKGLKLTVDGIHFTKKGYEILADIMLKYWNLK